MTIDEVVQILNASQRKPLTSLQEWLLRQAWEGRTYSSMALEANYVEEYLRKTAAGLWTLLSELWGEPINKTNFRLTLESRTLTQVQRQLVEDYSRCDTSSRSEFPSGPLALNSKYYISRPPIEELAYEEISKPGSVICIKGPRKMGKSSIMLRIVAHATALQYRTASIDFQQADSSVFTSLDKFLRWFSANVTRELQLEFKLDDYWDRDIGSKVSCTIYFQAYLLEQINSPLVLALNEVNRVFEYPEIAHDFLPLLRYWHEQSKKVEIWQKLRQVVAYSTEIYIPLKLNQSPFNIGLPLRLPPFTVEQIQALSQRYKLDWTWTDGFRGKRLMSMVGGHPYLVQLAFYHLSRQQLSPKQLLQQAASASGIYHDHLQQLLGALQAEPELKDTFKQVVIADHPVALAPILAHKLESMGLVTLEGDRVTCSCELYRLYFKEQLQPEEPPQTASDLITQVFPQQLATENRLLQQLLNLDEITQLANRRFFNNYLQAEWQRSARDRTPLSLIICSIDYFKTYIDMYGESAGENCLRKVAKVIDEVIHSPVSQRKPSSISANGGNVSDTLHSSTATGNLAARYGSDEFIIILPELDTDTAVRIGEKIRKKVKALAISTNSKMIGGFPDNVITISVGVSVTIANADTSPDTLVHSVEQALYLSRREGRNCVISRSIAEE
jgi:GGDEF domain-containing protein